MAEKLLLPDLSHADDMFLHELQGRIGELAHAHLQSEKEFFPTDFEDAIEQAIADGELDLQSDEAQFPGIAKIALFVNLLTELGIPYYTSTIQRRIPVGHPIRDWSHYWTADEGRHGPTIAGVLHKTKQSDMRELERARMTMMRYPDTPQPGSVIESFLYPAIQEPATEISHRNTMRHLPKVHKIARQAIGFVIGDEVRHGNFYGGVSEAAILIEPNLTVIGLARQVRDFSMPGKSIPSFDEMAKRIDEADVFGIKQLRGIYEDLIVNRLGVFEIENLSPVAEQARQFIKKKLEQMDKVIQRREERAALVTASL